MTSVIKPVTPGTMPARDTHKASKQAFVHEYSGFTDKQLEDLVFNYAPDCPIGQGKALIEAAFALKD